MKGDFCLNEMFWGFSGNSFGKYIRLLFQPCDIPATDSMNFPARMAEMVRMDQ
jgi:hypothetical protein